MLVLDKKSKNFRNFLPQITVSSHTIPAKPIRATRMLKRLDIQSMIKMRSFK